MRVIEPDQYPRVKRRRAWRPVVILLVVIAIVTIGILNYIRPLPDPVATVTISTPPTGTSPTIDWPSDGQAAVAADGYKLLGTHGDQRQIATASTTKVIAALCVLQKQPLSPGQDGPTYTISQADVNNYQRYADEGGSLVSVTLGEHLTEYQALEALMIPSANNIADSLVRWVFGSQDAYTSYATTYLQQHGLNQTRIGKDASGFDPSTTSTASDLTSLGLLALKSPVLMQIAGKSSTNLPVAGSVTNYNTVLGVNGINGLKTGNSDDDTGAFIFTAIAHIGGQDIPTTGAVMDAPDLDTALQDSTRLAASVSEGFEADTIAKAGQSVGSLHAAWGASAPIVPRNDLTIVRWKGTPVSETHQVVIGKDQSTIGMLTIAAGHARSKSSLYVSHVLTGPSFWWRLTRH